MKKMGMIFGSLIFVLAAVLAVLAVTGAQKSRSLQQEMKRMDKQISKMQKSSQDPCGRQRGQQRKRCHDHDPVCGEPICGAAPLGEQQAGGNYHQCLLPGNGNQEQRRKTL